MLRPQNMIVALGSDLNEISPNYQEIRMKAIRNYEERKVSFKQI